MIHKIYLAALSKSVCLVAMLLAVAFFATPANAATGPYFGQTVGTTPMIFAPGIVSLTNRLEYQIDFSPDGNECFFRCMALTTALALFIMRNK